MSLNRMPVIGGMADNGHYFFQCVDIDPASSDMVNDRKDIGDKKWINSFMT